MATWPTSPASTANLDAGTDRPSLARADLKNNVDNTNAIIDMFNITASPSNNSILKYSTSTSKFELTTDADVNTTYTISAVADGSDANIRLTGSDSSIDEIQLIAGSNITLAVTSAGAISIAAAGSTGMTSFTAAGDSGSSQTIGDGNTLTISGGTGLSSVASATDTITINLDNTAVTPNTYAIATITVDQQGRITSASAASTTGTGNVVLASSPTLTTPTLGVATATTINKVTLTAPASGSTLTIADGKTLTVNNSLTFSGTDATTLTLPGITSKLGFLNLPAVGTKTTSYQLTTSDVGKYVQVGSGGSITIPDATFSEGDAIVIANNHSAAITITCSITTAYIAGTDTDKATVSLATRGVCNILFLSGTVCIITGNVS